MDGSARAAKAEYERRLHAVRAIMAEAGWDVLVAGDNGGWAPPTGDVRYLTNFSVGHLTNAVAGAALVLPLEGDPVLVVPGAPNAAFAEWARVEAWTDRVTGGETLASSSVLDTVAVAVIEAGYVRGRVGVCGGGVVDVASFSARLPHATVGSAHALGPGGTWDPIEVARRVKSPWEIDRLRLAQTSAELGMAAFMAGAQDGRRHVEAIAEAELAAVAGGAEDALIIMNCGTAPWMWWHMQGERRFQPGCLVSLETNARVQGYCAQFARSGPLGETDPARQTLVDVSVESLHAMVDAAQPGVTGDDLWQAGNALVERAGLQVWSRLGHGMGLSMDEGFNVVPGDRSVLEPGMSIELHASAYDPACNDSVLLGEQYIVTADGVEPLSAEMPSHRLRPSADQQLLVANLREERRA